MKSKGFLKELNIFYQCKQYDVPLFECPQFLFMAMGAVIILTTVASYLIGARYIVDLELVVLIVVVVTSILLVLAFIIMKSFERLAEANRMKTEFVSIVSHQLRAPLSNLRWGLDALITGKEGVTDTQADYLEILKENTARMTKMISDLLTVSRIDQNSLNLAEEEVSVEDLVNQVLNENKFYAEATNIKIELNIEKNIPPVSADPIQLRLAIENLFNNSIKYIKEKGVISISLSRKGNDVLFEIKDSGVGIPEIDQKHIFKKFFRSKNALRQETQGTGLGLFICKSIIEKTNGKIGFTSQENEGSVFWFTLPLKTGQK